MRASAIIILELVQLQVVHDELNRCVIVHRIEYRFQGGSHRGRVVSSVAGHKGKGWYNVAFDDGDKKSYDFKDEKGAEGVVIGPYDVRGVCIIRELEGKVHARTN